MNISWLLCEGVCRFLSIDPSVFIRCLQAGLYLFTYLPQTKRFVPVFFFFFLPSSKSVRSVVQWILISTRSWSVLRFLSNDPWASLSLMKKIFSSIYVDVIWIMKEKSSFLKRTWRLKCSFWYWSIERLLQLSSYRIVFCISLTKMKSNFFFFSSSDFQLYVYPSSYINARTKQTKSNGTFNFFMRVQCLIENKINFSFLPSFTYIWFW